MLVIQKNNEGEEISKFNVLSVVSMNLDRFFFHSTGWLQPDENADGKGKISKNARFVVLLSNRFIKALPIKFKRVNYL